MSSLMEDSEDKERVEIKDIDSLDNIKDNHYSMGQKFLSEFIGCFFLLFIGSGVGVYTQGQIVPVVLANGFVVGALIYIFGRISGAHFNPSVSIPMYLAGKITFFELFYYTLAQLAGGFLGSLFVALCNKGKFDKLSSTQIGDYLIYYDKNKEEETKEADIDFWSYMSAFLCEFFLTFLLVMVVFASTVKKNNFNNLTGLIIGVTLIMLIFTGFYLSGGSLNPVRSIPPAAYEAIFGDKPKAIKQIWIYIVGPISGGVLASIVSIYFS